MTTLSSGPVSIPKKPEQIYNFLADFNNFGKLMPQQVVNYTCTENDCQFTIQGMGTLGLKHGDKRPHSFISMQPNGKAPFNFSLEISISPAEETSTVELKIIAELNPFLKIMAEKPLTNFLGLLAQKLKEI